METIKTSTILFLLCISLIAGHDHYGVGFSYQNRHDVHHGHDYHGHDGGHDAGYWDGGHGHDSGWDDGYAKEYHHIPNYSYNYGVKDPKTGDHKDAWETRHGDVVKGGYSLYEPDGTQRVVEYVADKHNGFNAVVKKIGHAYHPQVYGHGGGGHGGDDWHGATIYDGHSGGHIGYGY